MRNYLAYLNRSLFLMLILGSIFITSSNFMDSIVTPKWIWCGFFVGLIGVIFSLEHLIKKEPVQYNISVGFKVFICCCTCQAIYGLLKYYGAFPSYNEFIVGSFDNPVGLVSCLCFVFPFILYYIEKGQLDFKVKLLLAIVISLWVYTIFISFSRCGVFCIFLITFAYLYKHYRKNSVLFMGVFLLIVVCTVALAVKTNSLNGRILIWKCSLEMIKDNPLGYGKDGFTAHYMDYQADYFTANPDSAYSLLADNVRHPFNEYLHIIIQYGVIGFFALMLIAYLLIRCYKRKPSDESFACLLSLVCMAVFSCFSYPFNYPFSWIILFFSVIVILRPKIKERKHMVPLSCLILITSLCLSVRMVQKYSLELRWKSVSELKGEKEKKLKDYYYLYSKLKKDPFFLYNYAATLYQCGENHKALSVANYCKTYFLADYELELLRANLYKASLDFDSADKCFKRALVMCPSRFVPLYGLYTVYKAIGDTVKQDSVANVILSKKIKVDSPIVREIRKQVLLELEH